MKFIFKYNKKCFEFCIADYITKCEQILNSILNEINLGIDEIVDVVLEGDSTKIQKIQYMVKFFNKEVKKLLDNRYEIIK